MVVVGNMVVCMEDEGEKKVLFVFLILSEKKGRKNESEREPEKGKGHRVRRARSGFLSIPVLSS